MLKSSTELKPQWQVCGFLTKDNLFIISSIQTLIRTTLINDNCNSNRIFEEASMICSYSYTLTPISILLWSLILIPVFIISHYCCDNVEFSGCFLEIRSFPGCWLSPWFFISGALSVVISPFCLNWITALLSTQYSWWCLKRLKAHRQA